jgi:hypothetical protein
VQGALQKGLEQEGMTFLCVYKNVAAICRFSLLVTIIINVIASRIKASNKRHDRGKHDECVKRG